MGIVMTRIDNRLIHGQVLEAWVPTLHVNCIVVANDEVGSVAFRKVLMAASVPRSIRVIIGTVAEVAAIFQAQELKQAKVLLLFANTGDALAAYRRGILFPALNLGNLHAGTGKQRISCTVSLDTGDIDNLESLEGAGVKIVSQCVPADRAMNWRKIISFRKDGK